MKARQKLGDRSWAWIRATLVASMLSGVPTATADRDAGEVPSLAGQWRGELVVGDGKTAELVVDLGLTGVRWVGQFDLSDFEVENYPVEVKLDGRSVRLYLTAAQIQFEGTLAAAGDTLAGIATTRGNRDSLVLIRIGDARLTQEFLGFEEAAEDSTRLELLSADAGELRRRFNEESAYTRLVMLLSPT